MPPFLYYCIMMARITIRSARFILIWALLLSFSPYIRTGGEVPSSRHRELLWSDEFDYTGIPDSSSWIFETGGHGWGNNEKEFYLAGTGNAEVKDGKLVISARKEEINGRGYTSARIMTKHRVTARYGRIEARMKLPYGQGIWPAFWMLGENIDSVGWPNCGEIDIMEMIGGEGRENTVHGTAHWADSLGKHKYLGEQVSLPEGNYSDDFHIFSVQWDQDKITWYMDGTSYHVQDIKAPEMKAFHKPFFMILNLAVGGYWPGYPDSTTVFPQHFEVDYVRVYSGTSGS